MTSHRPSAYSDIRWKTSSICNNGSCVEVARLPHGAVGVRDNKDVNGPILEFSSEEFRSFVRGINSGAFDR